MNNYWEIASEGLSVSDYPEIDDADIVFPHELFIAFAVCICGRKEFIVDGSTQICHYCGKMMFRLKSEKFIFSEISNSTEI